MNPCAPVIYRWHYMLYTSVVMYVRSTARSMSLIHEGNGEDVGTTDLQSPSDLFNGEVRVGDMLENVLGYYDIKDRIVKCLSF